MERVEFKKLSGADKLEVVEIGFARDYDEGAARCGRADGVYLFMAFAHDPDAHPYSGYSEDRFKIRLTVGFLETLLVEHRETFGSGELAE